MFLCQNKRILYLTIISLVTITVIFNDVIKKHASNETYCKNKAPSYSISISEILAHGKVGSLLILIAIKIEYNNKKIAGDFSDIISRDNPSA